MRSGSLIVTTYNNPQYLRYFLESVLSQKVLPLELIIGDDGSREETRSLIESYREKIESAGVRYHHIWHEDIGYRRAKIINKCLGVATGDVIIFTDGDCILHPFFVADHLASTSEGTFSVGKRVNITQEATQDILSKDQFRYPSKSEITKKHYSFHCPLLGAFVSFLQNFWFSIKYGDLKKLSLKGVLGCNLSFNRKDVLALNGFDEVYEGWGREDNDFVLRMLLYKRKRRDLFFAGILFHLYHPENDRSNFGKNDELFAAVSSFQARKGIR